MALLLPLAAQTADAADKKRVAEKEIKTAAEALSGSDATAAAAAATMLGEVRNPSATAVLVDALALGLAPSVGVAALTALGARGDKAAVPTLTYYASVRSKTLRGVAVRAAAALSGPGDDLVLAALDDPTKEVRAVAAELCATRKLTRAAKPLITLLVEGEMPAALALGALADAETARAVAETVGQAPAEAVAEALGTMLLRADFGPDTLRVEVVRALAKVPGNAGSPHLAAYIAATPEKPPRASRREAEKLLGENL